jgi:hypothetical protein
MIWLKYCSLRIKQQLLTQLLPIILVDTLKFKNIAENTNKIHQAYKQWNSGFIYSEMQQI